MKNIFLSFFLAITIICCNKIQKNELDLSQFESPSEKYQLHTWWHWMQGNITKEGITKDLEAMKKNGIIQATILNIGLLKSVDYSIPRAKFNTPEWYEMFGWAIEEANRLGIKIGAHNSDGWSSSGGPWITPENSMKLLTWSSKIIEGGKPISIIIPKPSHKKNYFEDISVFAVADSKKTSVFSKFNPEFLINNTLTTKVLCDGSLSGGQVLKYEDVVCIRLDEPIETNKIAIAQMKPFTWEDPNTAKASFKIYTSKDGIKYDFHDEISVLGYNKLNIISIKPTKSQYFKIKFSDFPWSDSYIAYYISEIEFLNNNESSAYNPTIENITCKTSYTKANSNEDFFNMNSETNEIHTNYVDLSSKMDANGQLNWDSPVGNWKIIRLGYTTSEAVNAPATAEGEGLECDKMDTAALNFHFSKFSQKMIDKAGKYKGNTFKFLLIDSWECGFQNWTKNFPQEFEKRRGYTMQKFYPVLCGLTVESTEISEAFLFDYRKTIAELIEYNYYGHFNKLCHKNNLEMHAEIIYGSGMYPPIDVLKTNRFADLPMFEFWAGHNGNTIVPEYTPRKSTNLDFPVSAALFYEKQSVAAEAFTAMAHYSETPFDLKPFGDAAYSSGINQFILHSYAHQPTDSAPGFTLGMFGSHFNRNNPWFKFGKSWSDYHARIQFMLQQGEMQADVLYYVGDQLPQSLEPSSNNIVPNGFHSLVINSDILINKLKLENGKLIFKNCTFSIVYLPQNIALNLESLLKIEELLEAGMIFYGYKPAPVLSVKNFKEEKAKFDNIISKIWSENKFLKLEKGKICNTNDINLVLSLCDLKPEVSTIDSDSSAFLYNHRVTKTNDIYFVCNQTNQKLDRDFKFRTKFKHAKLYNPATGEKFLLSSKAITNRLEISQTLSPFESMIIVFDDIKSENLPVYKSQQNSFPISIIGIKMSFTGKSAPKPLSSYEFINIIASDDLNTKYFSGFINYEINFKVNEIDVSKNYVLNLGDFSSAASLTLNGVYLGTAWIPNFAINTKKALKQSNTLNITVGTTYRNRAIGDYAAYGLLKNVWTTRKEDLSEYLNKDRALRTSGVVGPLTISIKNYAKNQK